MYVTLNKAGNYPYPCFKLEIKLVDLPRAFLILLYTFAEILNFGVKVDWCLEGICKVLHENVKGLQFPKTHNNF